ncbi:zinc finger MYM-type protein 5-like [Diabrotica virgifera virgifera]|uniref:TTF-type domain-containing protein n=1 Tax=Diabrotica virgifera virgifera TaxID=50390 RepID=A0ABM5L2J2_DIAVI|nr:zinc finger MYM-type protein 5-like [Diabrotica virgifera virgifera]
MKRYQSGAEKKKRLKRNLEIAEQQKNSLHKFLNVSTENEQPCTTSGNSENPTVEISSETCIAGTSKEKLDEEVEQERGENPKVENSSYVQDDEDTDFDVTKLKDIALWPAILTDKMIDYILRNKPTNVGNIEELKSAYKDRDEVYYRGLSHKHFYRTKSNGIKEDRDWLKFSETSKSVYCYPCKLFSASKSKLITGFQNWKTIIVTLSDHELSKEHMVAICTLYKRTSNFNRVDTQLLLRKENEVNYWKKVLQRVISTIKLLSSLGIAFRGHNEE